MEKLMAMYTTSNVGKHECYSKHVSMYGTTSLAMVDKPRLSHIGMRKCHRLSIAL